MKVWELNCYETAGGCTANILGSSPEDCIEKWNHRAAPSAAVQDAPPHVGDTPRHPVQPLMDDKGVLRFKKNAIVRYLLDSGPFDLNAIAAHGFSDEDQAQFAQLIGYSLSGFAELGYVDDETYERAAHQAAAPAVADAPPPKRDESAMWFDPLALGPLLALEPNRPQEDAPLPPDALIAQLRVDARECWREAVATIREYRAALAEKDAALRIAVRAMRAPLDDWKGELERTALDAASAALGSDHD